MRWSSFAERQNLSLSLPLRLPHFFVRGAPQWVKPDDLTSGRQSVRKQRRQWGKKYNEADEEAEKEKDATESVPTA
jgi:hypothetical protein